MTAFADIHRKAQKEQEQTRGTWSVFVNFMQITFMIHCSRAQIAKLSDCSINVFQVVKMQHIKFI